MVVLKRSGAFWGRSGVFWGAFWSILGTFWNILVTLWGILEGVRARMDNFGCAGSKTRAREAEFARDMGATDRIRARAREDIGSEGCDPPDRASETRAEQSARFQNAALHPR